MSLVDRQKKLHQEEYITYRISFSPSPDLFMKRTDPALIMDKLHTLGECRIAVPEDTQPEGINHKYYYTDEDVILTTNHGINAIKDIFIFLENNYVLHINAIDNG